MNVDPKTAREIRAGLGGHGAHTAEPECPIPYSALDRPEFADLAKAVTAWEAAVHKREDAQLDYEDAESAYGRDLAAWNRDQQALAVRVAQGDAVPAELPARPVESSYEPHTDLMSRLAERAMVAERRATRAVEAEYRKVAAAITAYAAEQQRERSAHVRSVLAEALAQVETLRAARALALASRTVQTADEIGEAAGWSPERARQRHALERAHFYAAEQFGRRAAREHEQHLGEAMSTLRGYVEAVAAENFAAAWPDHADPAFNARRSSTEERARGASFRGI
ncbi:hypothetical protein [Actinoplanes regularis]|uniref:Uncharacterized protein n=1 Tax=Actinoplanes regularis TaxID=52697 RepID=A0A238XGG6_9ACTN|nr:hypothetical protein [Actinoplanes regularis]GIE86783.1 hypothetical protein Are01nite_32630 [Actinoplanes regularis]SNR57782.1 hypothetical protein SAMN06264365_103411 [Actinoplanes regularis]